MTKKGSKKKQKEGEWSIPCNKMLLHAAKEGNLDELQEALEEGANINCRNQGLGCTPLSLAVENENDGADLVVGLLIEKKADVNAKDNSGETVLQYAARYGNKPVMRLLIDNKADVNAADPNGDTPLSAAVYECADVSVFELLLNSKANVNAKNEDGETALDSAKDIEDDQAPGVVQLLEAAVMQQALEKDVVNVTLEFDRDSAVVRMSLAELNAKHSAALEGVELKTADDLIGGFGKSALIHAAVREEMELVKDLIEVGAQVDFRQELGSTALMAASRMAHTEIVRLLIEANAQVNLANDNGNTALMNASHCDPCEEKVETVRLLIEAGAQVDMVNKKGWSALALNRKYHPTGRNSEATEIAEILRAAGATREHRIEP